MTQELPPEAVVAAATAAAVGAAASGASTGARGRALATKTQGKPGANGWLVAGGVLILAFFFAGVMYSRLGGSRTTEVTTQIGPPPTTAATAPAATAPAATIGDPSFPGRRRLPRSRTTKRTTTKTVPSDTILAAILSAGGGLVLIGAFYSRLTTIKLAGVELGLGTSAQETGTLATQLHDPGAGPEVTGKRLETALGVASFIKDRTDTPELAQPTLEAIAQVVRQSDV